MHALTFHGIEDIRYEHADDPVIQDPHDIILKVTATSICGSDLHPYFGREQGLDPGTTMGHEFVGTVVETGRSVAILKKGMTVVSAFSSNCGQCRFCRNGLSSRCISGQLFGWVSQGIGLQGGQAEYVRIPYAEHTVLPVPDLSPSQAIIVGDILATGYFCALQAEISPAKKYGLIGYGPVGRMAADAAVKLGAETLIVVENNTHRRNLAKKEGFLALDSSQAVEFVVEHTDGIGLDACMEAVGSLPAQQLAFELLSPGGIISTVGFHTASQFSFTPTQAYDKNLTFKIGRCPARSLMPELVQKIKNQDWNPPDVFSHHMPLSSGQNAYQLFANKADRCTKVLLLP